MDEKEKTGDSTIEEKSEKRETVIERAKMAFKGAVERGKAFYRRNESWIKPAGIVLLMAVTVGAEETRNAKLRKENGNLREKNAHLREEHRIDLEVQDRLAGEVVNLRELQKLKDARHAEVASEDMRLGGSLGAQDLVALREYKKAQGQDRLSA